MGIDLITDPWPTKSAKGNCVVVERIETALAALRQQSARVIVDATARAAVERVKQAVAQKIPVLLMSGHPAGLLRAKAKRNWRPRASITLPATTSKWRSSCRYRLRT
jgi:uncharacterized protein YgbK (DUF1537 family)